VVEEDVRRVKYSPTRVVVVFALLFALGSFGTVEIVNPGKLLDWFIAFTATSVAAALAVAGGVWLFHYQDREIEEKLEKKLATRVAVELQMNLWLLEKPPSTLLDEGTGQTVEQPVVLVMLSNAAYTDLIRSNLLEPEDAMRLMNREGAINAHNSQMKVCWAHARAVFPAKRFTASAQMWQGDRKT
jgi:hypothetical protein